MDKLKEILILKYLKNTYNLSDKDIKEIYKIPNYNIMICSRDVIRKIVKNSMLCTSTQVIIYDTVYTLESLY